MLDGSHGLAYNVTTVMITDRPKAGKEIENENHQHLKEVPPLILLYILLQPIILLLDLAKLQK